ncbi:hypothetical protein IMZ29_00705 [Achromobacter sp. GG226]|uniref:hypothetical protein n=1 Tax=Verticiella alkaliphila TaxID=2779529 RepID=UPI001C0ACBBD|nr:hypothetical protein [Verticiella sp. GG226]MBU4609122.1 hypothetical protein [Verticiella sp. GG226]
MAKGIVVEGGSNIRLENNRIEGLDVGIELNGVRDAHASGNHIVSREVAEALNRLHESVRAADVPADVKPTLLQHASAMRATACTPSFRQHYEDFMHLASSHITVIAPLLTPLMPLLPQMLG